MPKRKSFFKNFDKDGFDLQHDLEGSNLPAKTQKKMHQTKSLTSELDDQKEIAGQYDVNIENKNDRDVTKKKSNHQNKTFTGNFFDADFNSLNFINEYLINNKGFKEKEPHKNKPSNVEVEDESIVKQHNTNVESENEERVKEKKKHKNKLASMEQGDENFALQHSTNVEFVDLEALRKKKKRHKNNSFSEVEDGSLVLQHNTIEESVKEPVKEKKTMHKSKLLSTEVHYEDSISESDVDNPSPILNQLEKNNRDTTKPSNKNKKESSNAMLSSSDEEICDIGSSIHFITRCLDFREEPVQFEVPLLHSCESVQQIGEDEREDLKSKGISVKMGRFSDMENTLLKRNYEEFTRRFGVNDPQLLLGLGLKYRNKEVAQFLKAKHFYLRLGKDLNDRPLCYIYKKARMLFDPRQKHKRLDATKVTHLKKAHDLVGNKWHEIGNIINRSANTARSAFFWHDEPVNHGKWTAKEEEELIKAIKIVLGVTDLCETELEGIPWENVANLVPTRNFHQCRLYWFENLSWKFKDIHWEKKDYSKLVSILSRECCVEDYSQIDWKEVQKCFGDLSPSWQFLRKKWYSLKKRLKKQLHEKMTYKQILDYFCAKYELDIVNRGIERT